MPTCARCGREAPDDASFCPACGAPLVVATAREERKVVTVLFADLVGFTGRAETLDPEDVHAMLSPFHARLRAELERRGGTVEKFIGDAVMALFGAPVAHEDDPERAVRAALAIRDWITEEAGDLQVRIAVNTGEALVKIGVRPSEGEGMAAGDVVNTTARLQAAAPVNGILVGETTYRATSHAIEYREAEAVVAKGKSAPVPVYEALAPRSRLGVDLAPHVETPLVGREDEVAVLREALSRTRRERAPQLVTLVGVPGIGKSRLVRELFEEVDAEPDLVFWRQGRCLPYGEGVTFWALAEMVKAHAGILDTDGSDEAAAKLEHAVTAAVTRETDWVLAQLRPLAGLSSDDEQRGARRDEAFAAWRLFFESLAEQGPIVLVFEDLHWADDGLLDFVDHLVDWASGVPLLVLCTSRPELLTRRTGWGGGKPNAVTISLSPLSRIETARLVSALLDQAALPEELQTALLVRADGNPLYAEEYVRMLRDRGFLHREGAVWRLDASGELPLPETVQGIIAARLDALEPEAKRLLQDAAVVGKVFWSGALAALGSRPVLEVEQALHALERRQLVRRDRGSTVAGETEYAFSHLLVRDVAYGQIPRGERATRHLKAAAWIESLAVDRPEDHAEMLAHHYLAALELERDVGLDPAIAAAARTALGDAGDRARALGALSAAAPYYGAALELMPPGERGRGRLLLRHGESLWAGGGAVGGRILLEARDAFLEEGDEAQAAEAELLIAEEAFDLGDGARAVEHLTRAVGLVEAAVPGRSKAFVVAWASHRLPLAGISEQRAVALAEEAVETARSLGQLGLEANALNALGLCRMQAGDLGGGIASLEEALELARTFSPFEAVRSYGNLASLLHDSGELARAQALHAEGLALARELSLRPFGTRWLLAELANDLYESGQWADAARELNAYLADAEVSPFFMDSVARGANARMLLATGDEQSALAEATLALDLARHAIEPQALAPALGVHARCLLELGRVSEAEAAADELAATSSAHRGNVLAHAWFHDLAVVLFAVGRGDEVIDLAGGIDVRTRWLDAATAYARGEYAAAADLLADIGCRPEEAHARLRTGDEAQVRRALDFYRSVGATRFVAEAQALLATSRSA